MNVCNSKRLLRRMRHFLSDESGPTAVEYAVMLALIIVVCVSAVQAIANNTRSSFDASSNAISGAMGG